jgi:hypothetical protein
MLACEFTLVICLTSYMTRGEDGTDECNASQHNDEEKAY